jgi:3-oxoacyl-[acyl-carrier-protein] synthase III
MNRAVVCGTGRFLPAERLTTAEAAQRLGVTTDWILQRTGIETRAVAASTETAEMMAAAAGRRALEAAGLEASALDLVIAATISQTHRSPGVAACAAQALGATCAAMDVGAACAGFVYAMSVAAGQIAVGAASRVLVIGVDRLTPFLDWQDPATATLFADGAGAVVLVAEAGERGVRAVELGGAPAQAPALGVQAGRVHMNGPAVYRYAVREVPRAVRAVVQAAGWTLSELDWLAPHQANARVLAALARRLELPPERVLDDIAEHGNTSAASIPIVLDEAARDGRLQSGHRIVLAGLGAGLVHGAVALRW